MNAHTPGPWKYEEVGDTGGENPAGVYDVVTADNYRRVCEFVDFGDARLIAAAPDLLAALERAERCVRGYTASSQIECDLSGIRAAIAKATT